MGLRSLLVKCACGVVAASMSAAVIAREDLPTPIPIEVTLRGDGPNNRVAGKLVAADELGFTLHVGEQVKMLAWEDLVPVSAFGVKFRLINKASANDWLALGRWGWSQGLTTEARSALGNARRLDKTLASAIDAILANAPGSVIAAGESRSATTKPSADPVPPKAVTEEAADAIADATQPGHEPGQQIIRYTTPTEAEVAAAIKLTRERTAEAERTLDVKFTEVETAHFLIYTNWDPREFNFLKQQCEGAYSAVAKQFNMPVTGNAFVGKLPIYMFATQASFRRFASEFDEFQAPETVLGYYHSSPIEQGHMAMWKPGIGTGIGAGGSREDAMRKWARTLVHEFSHAFIHRYKSNVRIPRWLNEGTAELIAETVLPTNNYHGRARGAAVEEVDIVPLFDDSNMPSGYYYPVMMTMAESLLKQDKKKFLALFDEIKLGTEPEAALKKIYGIDHLTLAQRWNGYAKALR